MLSLGMNSGVGKWERIDQEKRHLYLAKRVVGAELVECTPVLEAEELNLVFFEE